MVLDYRHADLISSISRELAEATTALQFMRHPELDQRYGSHGRARAVEDGAHHFEYLSAAIATGCHELFTDYMRWATVLLTAYEIPVCDIESHFHCMQHVLARRLPEDAARVANQYIERALGVLQPDVVTPKSYIDQSSQPELARAYLEALITAQRSRAKSVALDALASGVSVQELYLHVFQPCQLEVGRLWQLRKLTVAQEHFCTAATQSIMSYLYQTAFDTPRNGLTAVVGCVGSELHELGARMVADFLELDGWDTLYLGANTPALSLAQMVSARKANVVCLSTTLAVHIRAMADAIEILRRQAADRQIPILVGGYPFHIDALLWKKVNADGFALDARTALELATRLAKQQVGGDGQAS